MSQSSESNKLFTTIKENLSVLIIIPTFLGGIYQTFRLMLISPEMIRFFSPTQLISDGLWIITILLFIFYIPLIYILPQYLIFGRRRFDFDVRKMSRKEFWIIFTFFSSFGIAVVFGILQDGTNNLDSSSILGLFAWPSAFQIMIFSLIVRLWNLNTKTIFEYPIARLVLVFIVGINFAFYSLLYDKILPSHKVNNFDSLLEKFRCGYPKYEKAKVLYFNDKYIFIETDCEIEGKKLYIDNFNSILDVKNINPKKKASS